MSRPAGRVLALDLGEARIGLALSDPLGITAQPLPTLRCIGPRKDLARIVELIGKHDVTTVVIGLPLLLSGEAGAAAEAAKAFAERLRQRRQGLAVELWDERLTTVEAERALIAQGARRSRRKEVVDAVAATLILQGFLEGSSTAGDTGA